MKKHLLLIFTALIPILSNAHEFELNGIYYNVTSLNEVGVTHKGPYYYSYDNEYSGTVTIPSEVSYGGKEYSVTSIESYAFYECNKLTSIDIPESMTSIDYLAFYGCTNLTSINIPENSQLTSIGNGVFEGCSSLTSINIPEGVTSIGSLAFYGCKSLTSINLPENSQLTEIGKEAFRCCSNLTSIYLPKGVTNIDEFTFCECSSVTSITVAEDNTVYDSRNDCNAIIEKNRNSLILGCSNTIIPEGVKSIGNSAFLRCYNLTSITIPEGVTSIGESAFQECSNLTSITIPKSMTKIGIYTFSDCNSLTNIICKSTTPPSISKTTFYKLSKSIPIYIPSGSIEAYKSAKYWNEFTNLISMTTGINNSELKDDNSELKVYDLRGRSITDTKGLKGIYIVNGKKTIIK